MSAGNSILILRYKDGNRFAHVGGDGMYGHIDPDNKSTNLAYIFCNEGSTFF